MSINDSGSVIQGTELVLSCSILVHSAVDTDFSVNITWRSNPPGPLTSQYARVSQIEGSGHGFSRIVMFNPVNISDSASYTCTASISPKDAHSITASEQSQSTVNIMVISEFIFYISYVGSTMYHPSGLTKPNVSRDTVNSIAGSNFSIYCNFSVTPNLVGDLNVQWLNSSNSLVSDNSRLLFPHLLTSHGGNYTCKVTISIPLLNITLAGTGTTTVIVQSKSFLSHLMFNSHWGFLLPLSYIFLTRVPFL